MGKGFPLLCSSTSNDCTPATNAALFYRPKVCKETYKTINGILFALDATNTVVPNQFIVCLPLKWANCVWPKTVSNDRLSTWQHFRTNGANFPVNAKNQQIQPAVIIRETFDGLCEKILNFRFYFNWIGTRSTSFSHLFRFWINIRICAKPVNTVLCTRFLLFRFRSSRCCTLISFRASSDASPSSLSSGSTQMLDSFFFFFWSLKKIDLNRKNHHQQYLELLLQLNNGHHCFLQQNNLDSKIPNKRNF